jgi:hypothetical protein
MKRFLLVAVALTGLGGIGACNKPAAEDCRKAILNMEQLLGTTTISKVDGDIEGEVRRCKGGSSKDAVACAMNATTLEQLKACGFMGKSAKKS